MTKEISFSMLQTSVTFLCLGLDGPGVELKYLDVYTIWRFPEIGVPPKSSISSWYFPLKTIQFLRYWLPGSSFRPETCGGLVIPRGSPPQAIRLVLAEKAGGTKGFTKNRKVLGYSICLSIYLASYLSIVKIICIWLYLYMCVCVYIYVYMLMRVYIYIYLYRERERVDLYICVCIYICIYYHNY